eukprot:g17903.t1
MRTSLYVGAAVAAVYPLARIYQSFAPNPLQNPAKFNRHRQLGIALFILGGGAVGLKLFADWNRERLKEIKPPARDKGLKRTVEEVERESTSLLLSGGGAGGVEMLNQLDGPEWAAVRAEAERLAGRRNADSPAGARD